MLTQTLYLEWRGMHEAEGNGMRRVTGIAAIAVLLTCTLFWSTTVSAERANPSRVIARAPSAQSMERVVTAPAGVHPGSLGRRIQRHVNAWPPAAPTLTPSMMPGALELRGLRPFSADTHYMSLLGYVRYSVHERTGRWITYAEAARLVYPPRPPKAVKASIAIVSSHSAGRGCRCVRFRALRG
jgi:hypothetical protein